MSSAITNAGEALLALKQNREEALVIDKFILANVAGVDPAAAVNREDGMPSAGDIVLEYTIPEDNKGYINPNQVVYSMLLTSDIGDFDFNWIGLYSSADDTVVAISYLPTLSKRKTAHPTMGNALTRNFMLEYSGLQATTQIVVEASTWQIDFTARLKGIDERERLSNRDIYGAACFFGDGYLVVNDGGTFKLQPGLGYVEGIRIQQATEKTIAPALPAEVFLDVALQPQGSDRVAVANVVYAAPGDYMDGTNDSHYGQKIAEIAADRTVTDCRPKTLAGELGDVVAEKDHSHEAYADKDHGHTANQIGLTPPDGLSADNVQAAIDEIVDGMDTRPPLRQGIIMCRQASNGLPDFLKAEAAGIIVKASADDPLSLSIANGEQDIMRRVTEDVTLPIADMSDGTNYIYAEPIEDGVTMGATTEPPVYMAGTPYVTGLDVLPPATGAVTPGLGVVSDSTHYSAETAGYAAFGQTWDTIQQGAAQEWATASGIQSGWVRLVLDTPRNLIGYQIVGLAAHVNYPTFAPRDWTVRIGGSDTPDIVVDTQQGHVDWGHGQVRTFMFEAVDAKSLEINVTANNGGSELHVAEIIPLFAPDWGMDVSRYVGTSQRVYIGEAVKSGDIVTETYSYAPGVYAQRLVNKGKNVVNASRYVERNPFGTFVPVTVYPEVFRAGGWGNPRWNDKADAASGVRASDYKGDIVVQTGVNNVAYAANLSGSPIPAGSPITRASARINVSRRF